MTSIPWEQVRDVVDTVLDLPPEARASYLDRTCTEPAVRRYVESLIRSHEQACSFLDEPAAAQIAPIAIEAQAARWEGRRLGAYLIIGQIAQGGMGEVYRAVRADDQYQQQVAIKLVRRGFDSRFTLERLKAERQILAYLEHPNITRLLDGGATEDGLPYLVMEFVRGVPLDEYCDRHGLDVSKRLEIFRAVCSAVQYAHQNLVIHRDLKPSNILVTEDGTPKLLDFGIAKILGPDTPGEAAVHTLTMVRLLTPEYASPEQLRGEQISTASDVYSLGVVLYEILTGRRPFRLESNNPDEMARIVTEAEPEKPSTAITRTVETTAAGEHSPKLTPEGVSKARGGSVEKLRRRLSGDLDNIVLTALRKEPQRRYASVEQFAEDIRRHLEGRPVAARTDTLMYRSGKFVRRHKGSVATAVLVLISLLGGMAATLRQARISAEQRRVAERRLKDVRALASSYLFEFHDAIQNLPGSAPARHLAIQRGLEYLDNLSNEAGGDRELMDEVASGYQRIAQLQGNFSGPGIGDTRAALASYQKALAIREALVASAPGDLSAAKAEVNLLGSYTGCLINAGKIREARQMADRTFRRAEAVVKAHPEDLVAPIAEARAHILLASVMGGGGSSASTREIPGAIEHDREALKLLGQLASGAQDANKQQAVQLTLLSLAFHLSKAREFAESRRVFDELLPENQRDVPRSREVLLLVNWRGMMFERSGDEKKAFADYQTCLSLSRSQMEADPRDLVARLDYDIAQAHIGVQEARLGNKAAGKRQLDAAVMDGERLLASDPTKSFYTSLLAAGFAYQGELLSSMGDQEGAWERYTKALSTATATSQNDPDDLESRLNMAKIHVDLGVVLARAARYREARQQFQAALETSGKLLQARPQDAETLQLAELIRKYVEATLHCSERNACQQAQHLQLPTPLN